MSELKPCPCCGSEHVETCAEFWGGAAPAGSEFTDEVMCDDCGVVAPSVDAWNTRAERTCHMGGDGCFPPNCSACGWQADTYDCAWLEDGRYEYDGKFCKQCGAKVVEE